MILIPAAGEGRRFKEAGYSLPKHLLPLLGEDMVTRVMENVRPLDPQGDIYLVTQEWVGKTKGALDTILKAWNAVKRVGDFGHQPLVIANCDQLLLLPEVMGTWGNGIIFTFKSANPAHSYVATDDTGKITDIIEKPRDPVAQGWTQAVAGVYAFPVAQPFINAALEAQVKYAQPGFTEGEQYVSSALKVMIEMGFGLYACDVPTAILGTPEDFQRFEMAAQIARSLP